jgi:methyl-accepting chemotaxis protein
MNIEITIGITIILIFAGWASWYIHKRTKYNNNEHLFEFIPNIFPTLGILFTFLGIAIGLWNFDGNNIEKSIPELMNGLKTAFLVSIFGVALLVGFSFWVNVKKKTLEEGVLSDETIALNKLIEAISELRNDFSTTDDNGNRIKPGNIFRDIHRESAKQSNALQTFSSDLALTISAGFEQILNNPTEGVVAELKLVKSEIENLGSKLQDPATDMTQNIVKELQQSMGKMIEEFKTSMSGDTKNEMEHLAKLLGQAGSSLTDFPSKLQNMTDNLNENFRGLQDIVKQISQQTLSQSETSTNAMKKQVEDMSEILRSKVGDLQSGQQSLLTEQSKNLHVSESLLNAFNSSIENMNGLSAGVNQSITKLNQAQTELGSVVTIFRNVSQEVNASSSKFGESQVTFSRYSNEFLQKNAITIEEIQKSLNQSKDVSADYAQKFGVIERGLQGIFAQLQTGLEQYQNTVRDSVQKYLDDYTNQLTKAAESLAGASSKQEDILEELTEQLSKLNSRKY